MSRHNANPEECPFSCLASCLLLATDSQGTDATWTSAEEVLFVEDQVLGQTIDRNLDTDMTDIARKNPEETQQCIKDHALGCLGALPQAGQSASFLGVCFKSEV